MENIICIDLTKFNYEALEKICHQYNMESVSLINNKKNGFKKLWLCKKTFNIIAYNTKTDSIVKYTSAFSEILKSMDSVEIKKEPKPILNLDSILEKISKYGIGSISKEEKDFLDGMNDI